MTRKDFVSGLLTPVVIITSTLSYAALIFSGPLAAGLPVGIGFGLVCAGVMAILFAGFSELPFAIAGPDSKPVAVLAKLSATIAADIVRRGRPGDSTITVLFTLITGTVLTGGALYLLGLLRAGRWIRFVPYPVIAGFMAASGWLLAAGGVRLAVGTRFSPQLMLEISRGEHLVPLATLLAFTAAMIIVKRLDTSLAFPLLLVGGTVAIHAALHTAGYSLTGARAAGWLPDLATGAAWPVPALMQSLNRVDFGAVWRAGGGFVALMIVTAMTLLMSVVAVELQTPLEVDLDRELRLNGLANLLVGLGGGMTGTLSLSRTLFNYRTGARGRSSGILAGIVCLLVLAFGTRALGFVPVPILAVVLLQLGAEMLVEWLVRGWKTMQRAEYFEMATIFTVTVAWNFVAGVVLGFVMACIAFALNTSRVRLLKLGLNRTVYSGSVDRPMVQQEHLVRHGMSIQIMWLHGFVFFGSAYRLLLQIQEIVNTQNGTCRSLILDFRQVMGIDSSAVMSLCRLRQIAGRKGFAVVLSGVPPAVKSTLEVAGLIDQRKNSSVPADPPPWLIFPDTDSALEWCEEKLLEEVTTQDEEPDSADNWLALEIGNEELLPRLVAYLDLMNYQTGDYLIRQGEAGDSLYLLFAGRATVVLQTPQGAELRLRTMVGHTIVGEMGLYRALPRGASVRADQPTIAYRMSAEAMARMEREDPELAHAFHRLIIRTLAARLDFANREVAGLRR
jgi:SulP family sulfate permease